MVNTLKASKCSLVLNQNKSSNNTIFEGLMEDRFTCQISSLGKYRQNKQTNF